MVFLERPLPRPRVVSMPPPGVDGIEDPPGRTIVVVPLTFHVLEVEEDPDQLDVPCPGEPLEEVVGGVEGLLVHSLASACRGPTGRP